jgi:hypothetical protein
MSNGSIHPLMILFTIFIPKIAQWGTGLVLWSYEGKYQSFNPPLSNDALRH